MTSPEELYQKWIEQLWSGQPVAADLVADDFVGHWPDRDVRGPQELQAIISQTRDMFSELSFDIEVGPLVDGDFVVGRWIGKGQTAEGPMVFFGNDILRVAGGRFVEYWTGTAAG